MKLGNTFQSGRKNILTYSEISISTRDVLKLNMYRYYCYCYLKKYLKISNDKKCGNIYEK